MKKTVQFVTFVLELALASTASGQSSTPLPPPDVQRFGSLLVVAFQEDSPDPETYRNDLFSEDAEGRRYLLHALGFDSSSGLKELWQTFLKSHPEEDEEKILAGRIGGGLLTDDMRLSKSEPLDLDIGFEEPSGQPFEIRAYFRKREGHWQHIATLACNCRFNLDRDERGYHLANFSFPDEYVAMIYSQPQSEEFHTKEIRFRWLDERLKPLIEYQGRSRTCPKGVLYGPECKISNSYLEKTNLINDEQKIIPGFVLISYTGHDSPIDKKVEILGDPHCISYVWDENAFAYLLSPYKPVSCGTSYGDSRKLSNRNNKVVAKTVTLQNQK